MPLTKQSPKAYLLINPIAQGIAPRLACIFFIENVRNDDINITQTKKASLRENAAFPLHLPYFARQYPFARLSIFARKNRCIPFAPSLLCETIPLRPSFHFRRKKRCIPFAPSLLCETHTPSHIFSFSREKTLHSLCTLFPTLRDNTPSHIFSFSLEKTLHSLCTLFPTLRDNILSPICEHINRWPMPNSIAHALSGLNATHILLRFRVKKTLHSRCAFPTLRDNIPTPISVFARKKFAFPSTGKENPSTLSCSNKSNRPLKQYQNPSPNLIEIGCVVE